MKDFKTEAEKILGHTWACQKDDCVCDTAEEADALYQLHLEAREIPCCGHGCCCNNPNIKEKRAKLDPKGD